MTLVNILEKRITHSVDLYSEILERFYPENNRKPYDGSREGTEILIYSLFETAFKDQVVLKYEQLYFGNYLLVKTAGVTSNFFLYNFGNGKISQHNLNLGRANGLPLEDGQSPWPKLDTMRSSNFGDVVPDFGSLLLNNEVFLVLRGALDTRFVIFQHDLKFVEVVLKKSELGAKGGSFALGGDVKGAFEAKFIKNNVVFGDININGIRSILLDENSKSYNFVLEEHGKVYYCVYKI